jgi:hypothetical protein
MSWVLTALTAILAVIIGAETKYSRYAALLVGIGILIALTYLFAGIYFGWILLIPAQH